MATPKYQKLDKNKLIMIGMGVVVVGALVFAFWGRIAPGDTETTESTMPTDNHGNVRYADTHCVDFGEEVQNYQVGYIINAHDLEYFAYNGTSYVLCEIEFTNTSAEPVNFKTSDIRLYLDNEEASMVNASRVSDILESHLFLENTEIQAGRRESGYLVWSYYKDFDAVEVCYDELVSFIGDVHDATLLEVPDNMIYDEEGNLIDAETAIRTFFIVPGSNEYHFVESEGTNQCFINTEGMDRTYIQATPQQMHDWGYTPCPLCLPELSDFVIIPEPVETEPPAPPEPVWVPLLDEDGNPVYQTDEDGELILDDEDNPIPVMVQQ